MLLPVEISSFGVDSTTNSPVVVLRDQSSERSLAIPIGPLEASSIAIKSLNVTSQRPMTIDLAKLILEQLGGILDKAIIYDVVETTFLARLHMICGTRVHILECRPSDAIALALRCDAPMFVQEIVFEKSGAVATLSEQEQLRRTITGMDTADFGKYYLE